MAKASNPAPFVIEIADNALDTRIGYNGSVAMLKDRNDYDKLMEIALLSNDPSLLAVFKAMPSETEWADYKAAQFNAEN